MGLEWDRVLLDPPWVRILLDRTEVWWADGGPRRPSHNETLRHRGTGGDLRRKSEQGVQTPRNPREDWRSGPDPSDRARLGFCPRKTLPSGSQPGTGSSGTATGSPSLFRRVSTRTEGLRGRLTSVGERTGEDRVRWGP